VFPQTPYYPNHHEAEESSEITPHGNNKAAKKNLCKEVRDYKNNSQPLHSFNA
jgi:hypothetical protein